MMNTSQLRNSILFTSGLLGVLCLAGSLQAQLTITNLGPTDPSSIFLAGVPADPNTINSFKRVNEGDDTGLAVARNRGQVFLAPDTGDSNNGWSLTDVTVRWDDASSEYPTADFQVRLTVYPWQDLSNPDASNVDFNGGPTELPLQPIFSDVGSLPALTPGVDLFDGDRLRFSLGSSLELRENTAYGFAIEFDRQDVTALRIDDDAFRLESINGADDIGGSSLGINFDYDPNATGFSLLNSSAGDDMIFQLSGSSANIADDPFASLEVDRDTGNLSLKTNLASLADLDTSGYSITTSSGRLLSGDTDWLSLADSDPNWQENGTVSGTELSETYIGGAGSDQLSQSATLDLGNAWEQSPFEDLVMTMDTAGGSTLTIPIRYVSSLGSTEAFEVGDYNLNGTIDIGDWPTVRDNLLTDVSGLDNFGRYQNGDMNLDGLVNQVDFLLFRTAFEEAGGLSSALSAVPEPTCFILSIGAALVILGTSRKGGLIACRVTAMVAVLCLLLVSSSEAAITFTDDGATAPIGALIENTGNTGHTRVNDDAAQSGLTRIRGQSFTTISELDLSAITLQMRLANPGNLVPSAGSNPMRLLVWELDPNGSVAPSNGTVLVDDSGDFPLNMDGGDFFTMNLSSPVTLSASTQYGFSVEWASDLGNDIFPAQLGGFDGGDLLFNSPAGSSEVNAANGTQDLTFFLQGTANTDDVLRLVVNTSNGAASLQGNIVSQDIISYTITGTGLDFDDGWTSLESVNFDDGGWEEAGGSSATALGEVRLQGSTTFDSSGIAPLGTIYDELANAEELGFSYIREDQSIVNGLIEYFAGDTADYDADGDVDGDDLALWESNYGQNAGSDSDNNFRTDGIDFLAWQRQVGNGGGSVVAAVATVPEPSSALMLAVVSGLITARRLKRRVCDF